jgi:hypothetical protein
VGAGIWARSLYCRKGRETFGFFHLPGIEGRDCRRLEPLDDQPAAGVTIVFSRVREKETATNGCKKEPIQRPPNAARARSIA